MKYEELTKHWSNCLFPSQFRPTHVSPPTFLASAHPSGHHCRHGPSCTTCALITYRGCADEALLKLTGSTVWINWVSVHKVLGHTCVKLWGSRAKEDWALMQGSIGCLCVSWWEECKFTLLSRELSMDWNRSRYNCLHLFWHWGFQAELRQLPIAVVYHFGLVVVPHTRAAEWWSPITDHIFAIPLKHSLFTYKTESISYLFYFFSLSSFPFLPSFIASNGGSLFFLLSPHCFKIHQTWIPLQKTFYTRGSIMHQSDTENRIRKVKDFKRGLWCIFFLVYECAWLLRLDLQEVNFQVHHLLSKLVV